jgi:hypothetical protein
LDAEAVSLLAQLFALLCSCSAILILESVGLFGMLASGKRRKGGMKIEFLGEEGAERYDLWRTALG